MAAAKASTLTFRIEPGLKEALRAAAAREQTREESVMATNKAASRMKTTAARVSCPPAISKRPTACKVLQQIAFVP